MAVAPAGRLIAVVGPSGVGKDSVMTGMIAAMPALRLVKRSITRAPELGAEDYIALSPKTFEDAVQDGVFCIHWQAHGLRYGIPADMLDDLRAGHDCLCNFSRSALTMAAAKVSDLLVLNITASPETLAARLQGRGRETPQDIAKRLAQADKSLPDGLRVVTLRNDGPLAGTVQQAIDALMPEKTP